MRTKLLAMVAPLLLTALLLLGLPLADAWAQGGESMFDTVVAGNFFRAGQRATLTVTMNGTVNPTGTHQRLTAAGAVATSGANITVKPAGTLLILNNVGSNTITFTETGTLISAGDIVLGAGDSATLISDGTSWRQIAASNN